MFRQEFHGVKNAGSVSKRPIRSWRACWSLAIHQKFVQYKKAEKHCVSRSLRHRYIDTYEHLVGCSRISSLLALLISVVALASFDRTNSAFNICLSPTSTHSPFATRYRSESDLFGDRRCPDLSDPIPNYIFWKFWSHKMSGLAEAESALAEFKAQVSFPFTNDLGRF
jgi:hypothetical protein